MPKSASRLPLVARERSPPCMGKRPGLFISETHNSVGAHTRIPFFFRVNRLFYSGDAQSAFHFVATSGLADFCLRFRVAAGAVPEGRPTIAQCFSTGWAGR